MNFTLDATWVIAILTTIQMMIVLAAVFWRGGRLEERLDLFGRSLSEIRGDFIRTNEKLDRVSDRVAFIEGKLVGAKDFDL